MYSLLFIISLAIARVVHGEVIAAVVMPHGGIALDPTHFKSNDSSAISEAWALHNASVEVGKFVGSLQPDILLLSTPHGIADLTDFSFYLNSKGFGEAETDNCNCPPCCYNHLKMLDANVSGFVGYGDAVPFPLRWGEVIPLQFLLPTLSSSVQTLILSQPNRRYTQSVQMIPELITLGTELFTYLETMQERVVVVISADLAHTHLSSGPYGYSNASEPFDLAINEWASSLNSTALLKTASALVDRALSCGYTGLVMLHGLMEAVGLKMWDPKVYANFHPSYYGMMIASFKKMKC